MAVQRNLYTLADLSGYAHAADPCEMFANFGLNMGPRGFRSGLKRRGVSVKSILAGFRLKRSHGDPFRGKHRGFGIDW